MRSICSSSCVKAVWELLGCIIEQMVKPSKWLDSKINITTWNNNVFSEPKITSLTTHIICFKSTRNHCLLAKETFGGLLVCWGGPKNSLVVRRGALQGIAGNSAHDLCISRPRSCPEADSWARVSLSEYISGSQSGALSSCYSIQATELPVESQAWEGDFALKFPNLQA